MQITPKGSVIMCSDRVRSAGLFVTFFLDKDMGNFIVGKWQFTKFEINKQLCFEVNHNFPIKTFFLLKHGICLEDLLRF